MGFPGRTPMYGREAEQQNRCYPAIPKNGGGKGSNRIDTVAFLFLHKKSQSKRNIYNFLTAITVSDIVYYSNHNKKRGNSLRDSVKGSALTEVTFYILLSLFTPKHGYAIMQFIEEKTDGRLSLGAGTLYGALNTLENKGWIARYGDNEGRKKAYQITALGKEIAEIELARLQELTQTATKIMGDAL